jgi:hypothetical protein
MVIDLHREEKKEWSYFVSSIYTGEGNNGHSSRHFDKAKMYIYIYIYIYLFPVT